MSPLSCTFDLLEHIKTSKPNKRTNSIDIHGYQADNALCPLLTLRERKLFVSFIQPHKRVSRDTISRWAKLGLESAGIDTSQFTAHNTIAAISSKAKERDLPRDAILATAGWGSAATFQKFYDKTIIQQPTLTDTVLQM